MVILERGGGISNVIGSCFYFRDSAKIFLNDSWNCSGVLYVLVLIRITSLLTCRVEKLMRGVNGRPLWPSFLFKEGRILLLVLTHIFFRGSARPYEPWNNMGMIGLDRLQPYDATPLCDLIILMERRY